MTYADLRREWLDQKSFIECFTSGSTGMPSRIEIPKSEMLKSAGRTCDFFSIDSHSLLYSCISPDFIGGKMMWVRSLYAQCSFSHEIPSNRPSLSSDRMIDLVAVVPSQMHHILDNPSICTKVRNFLIGGSAIPDDLKNRIAASGISAWESYGMTETSSHIALRKVSDSPQPFKTLNGITVSADDDSRLVISIPGWKNIITNDVVEIIDSTQFNIHGRIDNVINTGGIKVYAEEIERKLSPLLSFPFYVRGVYDPKWGERVEIAAVGPDLDLQEIRRRATDILSKYEIPKSMAIIDTLPLTENGKIRRK